MPRIVCSSMFFLAALLCLLLIPASHAQTAPAAADPLATAAASTFFAPTEFDHLADAALAAMRQQADAMTVRGVAVVAYFEGETIQAWSSKMLVVGRVKDEQSGPKGSNLLAVAYAKASEMADTLKNSGSQVRPPMTGEFGWEGGVITHLKNGYLIAAFSGGKSADDVAISRTGVAQLLSQATPSHQGKPAQ